MAELPGLKPRFYTLELKDVAAGDIKSAEWAPSRSFVVKGVLFNRADGQPWSGSTVTIALDGRNITDPKAPVHVFGHDKSDMMPLEWPVRQGEKLQFSFYNGEGSTITVFITIVAEPVE